MVLICLFLWDRLLGASARDGIMGLAGVYCWELSASTFFLYVGICMEVWAGQYPSRQGGLPSGLSFEASWRGWCMVPMPGGSAFLFLPSPACLSESSVGFSGKNTQTLSQRALGSNSTCITDCLTLDLLLNFSGYSFLMQKQGNVSNNNNNDIYFTVKRNRNTWWVLNDHSPPSIWDSGCPMETQPVRKGRAGLLSVAGLGWSGVFGHLWGCVDLEQLI